MDLVIRPIPHSNQLPVFIVTNFHENNHHDNKAHDVVGSRGKVSALLFADKLLVLSQTDSKACLVFPQEDLNDFVRDFDIAKSVAEVLASHSQERNLLTLGKKGFSKSMSFCHFIP